MRTTVAVIGATGYAGATAVQLLLRHAMVEVTRVTSRSYAGKRLLDAIPGLASDLELAGETDPGDAEVVVVALPHGLAGGLAGVWRTAGRTVIDLGADFRLRDPAEYARWYGAEHPAPDLLAQAVFGLPELGPEALAGAGLVGCPGCYSTVAILALCPAVSSGLARPDFIVDAASGISGAGRSLALDHQFAEAAEDYRAYGVEGHRHLPEIVQALSGVAPAGQLGGGAVRVTFVPHLAPMARGILATCYFDLTDGASLSQLRDAYHTAYGGSAFVRMVDASPRTKEVSGTNQCRIHVTQQANRVVVTAAIDNQMKGAAGQAVQALNLVKGWPETTGLDLPVRWP